MLLRLLLPLCLTVVAADVWPMPASVQPGLTDAVLAPKSTFKILVPISYGVTSKILKAAADRYMDLIFTHEDFGGRTTQNVSKLIITVDDLDESHPQFAVDESYTLTLSTTGQWANTATLHAKTVWGAMHGMETFSQLVRFDFDLGYHTIVGGHGIKITDSPRFPHRGLMVDTARHYETLPSLKAMIASLPYSKINVLHWHISDSQSFPMQSMTYPKLWDGAFSKQERYTQGDVAGVVEWGRIHGVRVMVEFDMPGHAGSWCVGYPEVCPATTYPLYEPLNVANNATFDLITGLLGECTGGKSSTKGLPSGLFPDNFIHLGGDEVDTSSWEKVPAIANWLAKQNMTADQGYAYFVKRVANIALAQGRRPVQWSEVFDHFKGALDKRTVVHIWKSVTNVTEVVALGYDTIVNVGYNAKSWYLDNLNVKWDAVYSNEPCDGVPDDLCAKHVIGGHGEMWGETVDMSDLEQTVWPRLAAIGERLWSARTLTNATAALPRIEDFRCLLDARGVHAAPVQNANARTGPSGPGSCFAQRR